MGRVGLRPRRGGRALAACLVILMTCGGGCVGYVMGWADAEVERLRRIVAELEAKNAALVEEVIELRTKDGTTDGQQPPMNADERR